MRIPHRENPAYYWDEEEALPSHPFDSLDRFAAALEVIAARLEQANL